MTKKEAVKKLRQLEKNDDDPTTGQMSAWAIVDGLELLGLIVFEKETENA